MTGPGHGEKLSRKATAAIVALLECGTISDAAERVNVSERTLRRWLAQEHFRAAFDRAARDTYDQAVSELRALASQAVHTLAAGLSDKASPVQLRAARTVLDIAVKMRPSGLPCF